MATKYVDTHPQFLVYTNGNLAPAADGEIEFFTVGNTGASNRKDTYANADQSTVNPNPVPLDSNGRSTVPIFLDGEYNTVIRDSAGNQIDQVDNVSGFGQAGVSQIVVSNVAALRAVDTNLYTYAQTLGTSTTDDGGQSSYYFDATGVGTDNGTTIIEPTIGNGRWFILNTETQQIGDSAVTTAKINDYAVTQQKLGWYPLSVVDGLKVSNNSGTPDEIIDIAAGSIADTTQAYVMTLGSAFTKKLADTGVASTFAVGTGNGGLSDDDSLSSDTWYGVWLLSKSTDPTDCDVIIATTKAKSLSDEVATAAGFDISRLIGCVLTDSSSDILPFVDGGNGWNVWDVSKDENISESTSGISVAVSVPPFMKGEFVYFIQPTLASGTQVNAVGLLTQTDQTNSTPSGTIFDIKTLVVAGGNGSNQITMGSSVNKILKVDSGSQIRHRETTLTGTSTVPDLSTQAWQMDYTVTDLV